MRANQPGQSALLLLDVVEELKRQGIEYAVIGAIAASFYGVVRASYDADAVLSLTAQSLRKLEVYFSQTGLQTELRVGDPDDPIPAVLAIKDSYDNRVDLLAGIRGLSAEAFSRSVTVRFENTDLQIIGLEDFIAAKIFAGSPKDIEDARQAIAVSGESLDLTLLRKVASRFGKQELQVLELLLSQSR